MRKRLLLAALLLLTPPAFAQEQLPSYGTLADIKDFKKVYVGAEDEESRKRIIKALGKYDRLTVVNSPDDAEFFIEYGELKRESHADSDLLTKERKVKSQMRVYTMKGERKTIAWAETRERETEHFMGIKMLDTGRGESELTKKFIKALKKERGERK